MTVTNTRLSQQDPAPVEGRPATLFILVGVIAFLSGGALLYRGSSDATDVYEKARRLDSVVTLIADLYVDSLNGAQLYDLATDGMLRALGDPYTAFLDPADLNAGGRDPSVGRVDLIVGQITGPVADRSIDTNPTTPTRIIRNTLYAAADPRLKIRNCEIISTEIGRLK